MTEFAAPAAPWGARRIGESAPGAGRPAPEFAVVPAQETEHGVPGAVLLGRHAGAETGLRGAEPAGEAWPAVPAATVTSAAAAVTTAGLPRDTSRRVDGLRVLVIGGAEPLGGMIAERLIDAGHRIAVHDVAIPAKGRPDGDPASVAIRTVEPISLQGDRSDSEDVVHTVARAEVALGGLDAIVVLPARQRFQVSLDADAVTWADEWSAALTAEILAAACASHIAARSFLARRRAGRIVLVANGRDGALTGALPTSVTRAAIHRLGADLTRELGPHGIGVSVVTTGPGGTQDFAMTQVADVVEALLATPVLSGVDSQIG